LEVKSVAGHLLPPGSVFAFLAQNRRVLFPDDGFADLFASGRGRPSIPGDVIASVMVPTIAASQDQVASLKRLERQLREVEMENEFPNKAASYFAQDHR